ncbi:hypothetical protein ABGB17_25710 [Sphaerisporangium sp. B11E5]|uniref:hypothetical protein n=1 Tax=Sphaerisporangium sp. B11E5 TaxID=3153563 RepID=UPI00325EC5A3
MAFDEERYVREVLEPAREAGGVPPADLAARYQLAESMTARDVVESAKQTRQCWRRARGMLKYRRLIDRMEADHARFAPLFAAAAEGDLAPLRAALRDSHARAGRRLDDAARRLDDAAGPLRVLSPALLSTIARSCGVGQEEALRLAAARSIEVREPDPLPRAAPYAGYGKAREALDALGLPHLGRFVFGDDCAGMEVLDEVTVPGAPPLAEAVAATEARWAARPRGPWTVSADTVLAALRGTPDPATLVRYDVVARLRERVREHPYDDTLLRHATGELDLAPGDARRLIFAVRGEGGGVPSGPAARLRELVDAGEIHAAVDLADALGPQELTGEAAELVTEVRARLAGAVRLRDRAMAAIDPDDAWIALRDALQRVPDLPGAADMLARLAPYPARAVRAEAQGDGVGLTWQPSPSRAGRVVYDVFRNGAQLSSTERTAARDDHPPVNVPISYSVVARREDASAPASIAAPVVVRPEPGDVRLTAGDGVVWGRWTRPAEASRVVVSRDGLPVQVIDTGFRDAGVVNGTAYTYVIAAAYPGPEGEVFTPGVRHTVTPRGLPKPIAGFTLHPDPSAPGTLLAWYDEPPSGVVEFVALDTAPPWPAGATVPLADLRAASRAVPSIPTREGQAIRPGAQCVLLAVTIAGDLATVGGHLEHVNLATPTGLSAQRRGATVYVGFDWPPDVPEVEVRWAGRDMLVSSAAYRAQGGVRLEAPESEPLVIEVAPTALVRGERLCGPPAWVRLAGRVPVRYDLSREGPAWRRTVVVEVTADRPVRLRRLALVLKAGHVQPKSADDGVLLDHWTDVEVPARLSVPAPRQEKPYWLRCFAEGALPPGPRGLPSGDEDYGMEDFTGTMEEDFAGEGSAEGGEVALIDPPVRRMKVG